MPTDTKEHRATEQYLHFESYVGWWIKCAQCDGGTPGHRALLSDVTAGRLIEQRTIEIR